MGKDLPESFMPADTDTAPAIEASQALTLQQQTAQALSDINLTIDVYAEVEAIVPRLQQQYANVAFNVGTVDGMKDAKAARIAVQQPRYKVDKAAALGKQALTACKKHLDERALSITSPLVDMETSIQAQIKAEETRVAAEKEAIKAAKAAKEAKVNSTIEGIRATAIRAVNMTAADIDALRTELDATELLNEVLGERTGEALQAKMQTLETLDSLHGAAVKREAEAAQAAADRAELDKMRAERAERERKELADRQAIEQAAQAERDEANRLATEKLAADRAAFVKEQADARAALKTESDRLAAQQAELDKAARAEQQRKDDLAAAEKKRLDDIAAAERAVQVRIENEARAEEAARLATLQRQLDEEAAARRAEADRQAAEQRAAEEAAHQADQRGRDAWRVLMAALEGLIEEPQPLGIERAAYQAGLAAIELVTGEKA